MYLFTKFYFSLRDKSLVCEDQKFVLKSPKDLKYSARVDYRSILRRKFDLVLVENGYPLEPNFVVIQNISKDVDIEVIKNLNLSKLQNIVLS